MSAEWRDLDGKVAIVTGASRGVGAATAIALAAEGCRVVCAARATVADPKRLPGTIDEVVDTIKNRGGDATAIATDLSRDEDVIAMVARTVEAYGRVDLLVNNAAVTFVGDLDIPMKRFDLVMNVNLRAPFIATREVAPHMAAVGGGAIVNVSSAAAQLPVAGMSIYGISKIALEHLTVDTARELYPKNIAVNCFRIDVSVASEGFVANAPGARHETWEPPEVAAEGIVWMLRQPLPYSGRRESMLRLGQRGDIMHSRAAVKTVKPVRPTELYNGLYLEPAFTEFVDG